MQRFFEDVCLAAQSESTVLARGETGSGKSLVVRAIHALSPRAHLPFQPIDCAAILQTIHESELFGHLRGSFTGADRDRVGLIEAAGAGTIALEELAELKLPMQGAFLRVVQDREFKAVGDTATRRTEARILATTNRDIERLVAKGAFREDLYYRMGVITIRVPALREHAEDIPLLVQAFLGEFAARERRAAPVLAPEALGVLLQYPWPGNVRELRNLCERAVVMFRRAELSASDVERLIQALPRTVDASVEPAARRGGRAPLPLEEILRALEEARGNKTAAAARLGITRQHLHRRLQGASA